jgi:hypothetical protein
VPNESADDGIIPLTVGVTGHTDLREQDLRELEQKVRELLIGIRSRCPATPVELITCLAPGADQLAAGVALELGIAIVVPLPMPAAEYETTFASAGAVSTFRDLLTRADRSFVLVPMDGTKPQQAECFALAGAWVARHSQILIALWNGLESDKAGGTADVVRSRLARIDSLDGPETGLLCHIATPRVSAAETTPEAFTVTMERLRRDASSSPGPVFDEGWDRLNEYNQEVVERHHGRAQARGTSRRELAPGADEDRMSPGCRQLLKAFGCTDAAAVRLRRETRRRADLLVAVVMLCVIFFELYSHRLWNDPRSLAAYLGLIFLMLVMWRTRRWQVEEQKALEFRALAEALRVQFYWRHAGVRRSAADYLARMAFDELSWIRAALRYHETLEPGSTHGSKASLKQTASWWVNGQLSYYQRTSSRERSTLRRLHATSLLLLTGSLIAGTLLLIAAVSESGPMKPWHDALERSPKAHSIALFGIGLLSAGAALLHGYADKRGLAGHVRRYERMRRLYANAADALAQLDENSTEAQARTLFDRLGKEALRENIDWFLLHRDRPIEVPHAA